jgi:hypothetical protein
MEFRIWVETRLAGRVLNERVGSVRFFRTELSGAGVATLVKADGKVLNRAGCLSTRHWDSHQLIRCVSVRCSPLAAAVRRKARRARPAVRPQRFVNCTGNTLAVLPARTLEAGKETTLEILKRHA